ncbi:hypothetical protein JK358_19850 [Nocardia sp. 2]|uniref:Uncharacterized protein n=1 Tax=Nocardia acididurans TaxID=2802282 RepID=A0ABS1M7N7_9NOCA|nr:hypothetical protein [Nocardia acididurans]MBL1076657.1 hypothetical protein [Nocardia acididurans]
MKRPQPLCHSAQIPRPIRPGRGIAQEQVYIEITCAGNGYPRDRVVEAEGDHVVAGSMRVSGLISSGKRGITPSAGAWAVGEVRLRLGGGGVEWMARAVVRQGAEIV